MNGRTAQDSRIPANGTAPANGQSTTGPGHDEPGDNESGHREPGHNGHSENGHRQTGHITGRGPHPTAPLDPPAHWQAGRQVGEIRVDQPQESVRPPEWLSEVRDRPRDTGTTSLRQ